MLNQDFLDLLRAFTQAGVRFVVVGAHALAVHGIPRATGDLDVLVEPSTENANRVLDGLRVFGAPVEAHGLHPADLSTPGTVYQVGLPPSRIDILTSIDGIDFQRAWESRTVVEIEGLGVPFLGRDALLENKRAAGRPKDLADLSMLEIAERPDRP
ncbi:MAG TPA: hypothetical protein ENK19_04880 [Acidobacteria bacterium]|nr:hypothetical protein [Acidobacteriota bacterium]